MLPLPDLLCFSHLRWDFVWQRPQHLMTRAARSRHVWFIEEAVPVEGPPRMDVRRAETGISVVVPQIPAWATREHGVGLLAQLLTELVESFTAPPLHWYYTPLLREASAGLPASAIVYDCMDELSAFAGAPPELRHWETELLAAADLVFTGGASLYQAKRSRHRACFLFASSVDVEHFRAARLPMPDHDAQRHLDHPRVGYAGVLDERLDRDLLQVVATLRPAYSFVLVGPVVKIPPESLPRAPNLHYIGMQPYRELPRFLANWDIAILPFARNEATRFISPTKTPEYLAAGRRVVSTSIHDVVDPYGVQDLVQIADEPEAFAAALDIVKNPVSDEWLAAVDRHLSTLSWDRTWEQMHDQIRLIETARGVGPPCRSPMEEQRPRD